MLCLEYLRPSPGEDTDNPFTCKTGLSDQKYFGPNVDFEDYAQRAFM